MIGYGNGTPCVCGDKNTWHKKCYQDQSAELKRLTKQRDELLAAAVMAVEMIEYNKHERRHVRWKLNDAIAAVRGAAEIGKEIGE